MLKACAYNFAPYTMRAVLVIALCLALAGSAAAGDTPTDTNHLHHYYPPNKPPSNTPTITAWDFIQGKPELTIIAGVLEALGRQKTLSQSFTGTLLLPSNAAMQAYIDRFHYLPTYEAEQMVEVFWDTLMNYHTLTSVTSALQSASNTTLDTTHVREVVPPKTTRRHFHPRPPTDSGTGGTPGSSGSFHKLSFLRGTTSTFPKSAARHLPGRVYKGVTNVRDEHGDVAKFVSSDNAVLGGGLVHIMDAVLQPDDLYPSLTELLAAHSELSSWAEILKQVNLTVPWQDDCAWTGAMGELSSWEFFDQTPEDTCLDCSAGAFAICYGNDPWTGVPWFQAAARRLMSHRRLLKGSWPSEGGFGKVYQTSNRDIKTEGEKREPKANAVGAGHIELFMGTYALGDNKGIGALPPIVDRNIWAPILRFHFVSTGLKEGVTNTSDKLMAYKDGSFGRYHDRLNFLGEMRRGTVKDDPLYKHNYKGGDQPSIAYPTFNPAGGRAIMATAFINPGTWNLQTPGHFYHIINKPMVPPCETDKKCYPFKGI